MLPLNIRDKSWLQVEVCREYQRDQCARSDQECKFAHPPAYVVIENGKVTACFDSIKGHCQRSSPACKFYHVPTHLKAQVLAKGRNSLQLKNLLSAFLASQRTLSPVDEMVAAAALGNPLQMSQTVSVPSVPGSPPYSAPITPYAETLNPGLVATPFFTSPPFQSASGNAASVLAMSSANDSPPITVSRKRPLDDTSIADPLSGFNPYLAFQQSCKRLAIPGPGNLQRALPIYSPPLLDANLLNVLQCQQFNAPFSPLAGLPPSAVGPASNGQGSLAFMPQARFSFAPRFNLPDTTGSSFPATNNALPNFAFGVGNISINTDTSIASALNDNRILTSQTSAMAPGGAEPVAAFANNTACVAYLDESGELLHSLTICRDFQHGQCSRVECRYVHLMEDYVKVTSDGKVIVCRDFAMGKCGRERCKDYHIPTQAIIDALRSQVAAITGGAGAVPSSQPVIQPPTLFAPNHYANSLPSINNYSPPNPLPSINNHWPPLPSNYAFGFPLTAFPATQPYLFRGSINGVNANSNNLT